MISRLKRMEKEGEDPLSKEPPILRTGGRNGPTSSIEGISQCFDTAPCLRSPLGPNRSERLRVLGRTWNSVCSLLMDSSDDRAHSSGHPSSKCCGWEDSSCSSYHAVPFVLDT